MRAKKLLNFNLPFKTSAISLLIAANLFTACQERKPVFGKQAARRTLSDEFNKYWYADEAEITSYNLEQARYGEMRHGKAALIFVTEHLLKDEEVKADESHDDNIAVLKLNTVKKFTTGIYPYSIMTSTFFPVVENRHALKVSNSIQEWCGLMYAQINSREKFDVTSHSYFQGEADQTFSLDKDFLEDEFWTLIRVNPNGLPVGNHNVIPSLEFSNMHHIEKKAYPAILSKTNSTFTIHYSDLHRTITINFDPQFPHTINGWSEAYVSGNKNLTSKATRIKTIKTSYWKQNGERFNYLRDSLQL
ncbi:septum formation inhibitor Maf [Leeuwenhoekiella sp. A2]|uniref:septum formation inhibitor Maf n=1 Tax=Leeuwenhoekiella sp. A2 TaxID=3141460 RepID=UPI003A80A87C